MRDKESLDFEKKTFYTKLLYLHEERAVFNYEKFKEVLGSPQFTFVRSVVPETISFLSVEMVKKEANLYGWGRFFIGICYDVINNVFTALKERLLAVRRELNEYLDKTLNQLSEVRFFIDEDGVFKYRVGKSSEDVVWNLLSLLEILIHAGVPLETILPLYYVYEYGEAVVPISFKVEKNTLIDFYHSSSLAPISSGTKALAKLFAYRIINNSLTDFESMWLPSILGSKEPSTEGEVNIFEAITTIGQVLDRKEIEPALEKALKNNEDLWRKRALSLLYLSAKGEAKEELLLGAFKYAGELLAKKVIENGNLHSSEGLLLTNGNVRTIVDKQVVTTDGDYDLYNMKIKRKKPKIRQIL